MTTAFLQELIDELELQARLWDEEPTEPRAQTPLPRTPPPSWDDFDKLTLGLHAPQTPLCVSLLAFVR